MAEFAFVSTSSMCEGLQASVLWPHLLTDGISIKFAHRPFSWANLAANNAGVTVVVVGLSMRAPAQKRLYTEDNQVWVVDQISPYLTPGKVTYVNSSSDPLFGEHRMVMGSMPRDGGNLILSPHEASECVNLHPESAPFIRPYVGSDELVNGSQRRCIWVNKADAETAKAIPEFRERFDKVEKMRAQSPLDSTREFADRPFRFVYLAGQSQSRTVAVGAVSSERRTYLPVDIFAPQVIVSNAAFAIYDGETWLVALIASRMHTAWIAAVCGKLETRYRYSNTLGWNTFPVPKLTEKDKADLTRCAEDILLARESHFPSTIADLYDPESMPDNLRAAHDRNDEVWERIDIGRRFRNDTERVEKLFELYTKMTQTKGAA